MVWFLAKVSLIRAEKKFQTIVKPYVAIEMTQSLISLVRSSNGLEVNLISIERINDYITKPREVCTKFTFNSNDFSIKARSSYKLAVEALSNIFQQVLFN